MNKRFKLYLLSILYGFYNDGNVRMAVTEDAELYERNINEGDKVCLDVNNKLEKAE